MPTEPTHPDQLGGEARFRADLVAYLHSLPVHKLVDLLGELPSSRQEPLQLDVLMIGLNERLPDAFKLLPPAGQPAQARGGAARYGRWSPTAAPRAPAVTPARHRRGWPSSGGPTVSGRPSSTSARPVRARSPNGGWRKRCAPGPPTDQAAGRQEHGDPPAEPPERQREERDSQREEEFGDSWRAYRERADHIRQTYGWTVPESAPRVEPWLPLGVLPIEVVDVR